MEYPIDSQLTFVTLRCEDGRAEKEGVDGISTGEEVGGKERLVCVERRLLLLSTFCSESELL